MMKMVEFGGTLTTYIVMTGIVLTIVIILVYALYKDTSNLDYTDEELEEFTKHPLSFRRKTDV